MSRVLETPVERSPSSTKNLFFPRPRALKFEHSGMSINLVDFLSLRGCELQRNVARTNDSLGKVAKASTRLVLHLDFLRLAPKCIEYLTQRGDNKLADTLAQAVADKQKHLPQVIWRAILGSDEYRSFWRRPSSLQGYPQHIHADVDAALVSLAARVQRWLRADYQVDTQQLESDLQALATGDGGALLKSLSIQYDTLHAIDRAIAQRISKKPLCRQATAARGDILDNVVRKFFIADIQPWSAKLEARRFKLQPKVAALEAALSSVQPPAFSAWQQQRDALLARASLAPKQHAKTLLPLLKQCGKAPGG